tara:strand:- start:803 stop:913 length:111 start_codon:yes stop_codon:yes gene_type:complete
MIQSDLHAFCAVVTITCTNTVTNTVTNIVANTALLG